MKKRLLIALGAVAVLAIVGYQYRVELLVFVAPRLLELRDPIGPNRPVEWQPGLAEAEVPPGDRLLAGHNAEQVAPMWPSVIDSPQLVDKTEREAYEEGDEYVYWPN